MKSVFNMTQLCVTILSVITITTACGQTVTFPTATPTIIPVYTSTPEPSSTSTPSPTFTATPTLTPTPVLVSVIEDTYLYSGPGNAGYEKITHLPVGTQVEPVGEYVDFVLVRLYGAPTLQDGYVPVAMLGEIPPFLPLIPVERLPWNIFMSMAYPDKPILEENNSKDWVGTTLAHGVRFSDGLQIKLNIESLKGSNGIIFQGTGDGNPWWNGLKRIEFYYADGSLQILLRDGTQEQQVYNSTIPLQIKDGLTTGELLITFDKFGNNMQISQDNKVAFQLTFGNVGAFPDGLFPYGQILAVTLSIGPESSGRLTQLAFAVPPDGKYKK